MRTLLSSWLFFAALASAQVTVTHVYNGGNTSANLCPGVFVIITGSNLGAFGAQSTITVGGQQAQIIQNGSGEVFAVLPGAQVGALMTGLGATPVGTPTVSVGGQPIAGVTVQQDGDETQFYDVVFTVPNGLAAGPQPVIVSIGGVSATQTLYVGVAPPTILTDGVVPVFSTLQSIQPGTWVSIYGTGLISGSTAVSWTGNYPTTLGGTTVTIDDQPGYLSYASPTLINLEAPDDTTRGTVNVTVTNANGSVTTTVTLASQSPAFSLLGDGKHVAAVIPRSNGAGAFGSGSYDIDGPAGSSLGYPTVPAQAGDLVVIYGVGFGPTNPAVPAGTPFSGGASATDAITMTINGKTVTPSFAGVSSPGLFQFNLTIPSGLGTGDLPIQATVNGVSTQSNLVIALQ